MSEVKPKNARERARSSFRDTVAVAAMQGILSSSSSMRNGDEKIIAKRAYDLAEAIVNYRNSKM